MRTVRPVFFSHSATVAWKNSWKRKKIETMAMLLKGALDAEAKVGLKMNIAEKNLALPAYDYCLKCSHTFNLLNARGAISVAERTSYIGRVRNLARVSAELYMKQREEMGYPLLKTL